MTGGPASYGLRLVRELVELGVTVTVFTDEPERLAGLSVDVVHVPMNGGVDRIRWQYLRLGRALRKCDLDVYHDTKNALPFRLRVPAVVTVHDLAHIHCPETFGWASRRYLGFATAHAVKNAAAIVVPSDATAKDVQARWPEAASRVHTVHHGIDVPAEVPRDEVQRVRDRHGLHAPYILHVGTVQARKNVHLIADALPALRTAGHTHELIVAGRRGWKADAAMAAIERTGGARWLGEVPGEDLDGLYAGADVFVSPSGYEGFGFAVADAMARGVPVVVSPISSLPEVVGDAGVLLDDLSAAGVARALDSLLGDGQRRDSLATLGRTRASTFSWRRAAEGHVDAYKAALSE